MNVNLSDILRIIQENSNRPLLFEPGEERFWDDPYISKSMLEAHLNPDNDAASRKPETIDREVGNLVSSGLIKPGDRVLDLGCGPGLYASRLAEKGMRVTGVDISESSINYAVTKAKEKGLDISYNHLNFFDMDHSGEFDVIIQTYGELNTFSDKQRDGLLGKLHSALKPEGLLIFDITTRTLRMKNGLRNGWYASDGGFWRPSRHLVLEQGFDYPADDVWLDQYIVVDDQRVSMYNNWFHDYTLDSIKPVLEKAGFEILHVWNDLSGTPYQQDGDWIAIVARKR